MEQKPITVEFYCNNSIEEKLKKYKNQKKHDVFSLFQIRKTFLADNKPRFIFVSQEAHKTEQDFFNDPENKLFYAKEIREEIEGFKSAGIEIDNPHLECNIINLFDEFPYRETEAEAEKDMERFIDWLLIN